MVVETKRDLAWLCVLEEFLDADDPAGAITPAHIAYETGVAERTARDTLKTLSKNGFLQEDRIPDGRVRFVPTGGLEEIAPE